MARESLRFCIFEPALIQFALKKLNDWTFLHALEKAQSRSGLNWFAEYRTCMNWIQFVGYQALNQQPD